MHVYPAVCSANTNVISKQGVEFMWQVTKTKLYIPNEIGVRIRSNILVPDLKVDDGYYIRVLYYIYVLAANEIKFRLGKWEWLAFRLQTHLSR